MQDRVERGRDGQERRRGMVALAVAAGAVVIAMTAGITSAAPPTGGAAAWLVAERPAGAVLTIDGWGGSLADSDGFKVVSGAEADIVDLATSADPGSIVVPAEDGSIDLLRSSGRWTIRYRDEHTVVLVHDGALPVDGAT